MPTHPITLHYPVGKSARVAVLTVREDTVDYVTDTPEMLYQFWRDALRAQPNASEYAQIAKRLKLHKQFTRINNKLMALQGV